MVEGTDQESMLRKNNPSRSGNLSTIPVDQVFDDPTFFMTILKPFAMWKAIHLQFFWILKFNPYPSDLSIGWKKSGILVAENHQFPKSLQQLRCEHGEIAGNHSARHGNALLTGLGLGACRSKVFPAAWVKCCEQSRVSAATNWDRNKFGPSFLLWGTPKSSALSSVSNSLQGNQWFYGHPVLLETLVRWKAPKGNLPGIVLNKLKKLRPNSLFQKKLHAGSTNYKATAETSTPATAPAGTRRFWKTKATAYTTPEKTAKTSKIGRSCIFETLKCR